jgi:tetratricopeptide (TPR) repeat protein
VENRISGGLFLNTVVMGREVTVHLPDRIQAALSGLPAPSPAFTGRGALLGRVLEALSPDRDGQGPMANGVVVSGLAGVGKTELALQAAVRAHRQGWFPGGMLFVDLLGYDPGRALSTEQALENLLRALSVSPEHIPAGLEARQRLFRSVLDGYAQQDRRVLVVIDNARTADQARELVPTDRASRALVTSRNQLAELDALHLEVGVLGDSDSVALLDRVITVVCGPGDTRLADSPEAAEQLIRLCGRLPLALRIVGALLSEDPGRPVASLLEDLRQEQTRLEELQYESLGVSPAFHLSFRHLTPEQARLFRLLPLNPGPDVTVGSAAALAGWEARRTRRTLEGLARAHLLERGAAYGRWRMHDLVRLYAVERSRSDPSPAPSAEAVRRLWDHYLVRARHGDDVLRLMPGEAVAEGTAFAGRPQAVEWFDAERENLMALLLDSARTFPRSAARAAALPLALRVSRIALARRHVTEAVAAAETARTFADAGGDPRDRALALCALGRARGEASQGWDVDAEAVALLDAATALAEEAGDRALVGRCLLEKASTAGGREVVQAAVVERMDVWLAAFHAAMGPRGDIAAAVAACEAATEVLREVGDLAGEAAAQLMLSTLGAADTSSVDSGAPVRRLTDLRDDVPLSFLARAKAAHGLFLHLTGKSPEAAVALREAVRLCGSVEDAEGEDLALRIRSLASMGDAAERLDAAEQVAESAPDDPQALSRLALALGSVGRFGEAAVLHRRAANIYGQNIAARQVEIVMAGAALAHSGEVSRGLDWIADACTRLRVRHELPYPWAAGVFREVQAVAVPLCEARVRGAVSRGDRRAEGQGYHQLGLTQRWFRRVEEMTLALDTAADVLRDAGDAEGETWSCVALAEGLARHGRAAEARSYWERGRERAGTAGLTGFDEIFQQGLPAPW